MKNMLFKLGVKTSKAEFFNYEEEYVKLRQAIKNEKLIAVTGLRRVGKTSLLSVVFNEIKEPKVWIDGRKVNKKEDVLSELNTLLEQASPKYAALSYLSSVSIGPFNLKVENKKTIEAFEKYIKKKAFIFIDEGQRISKIDELISYIYDFSEKITVVIAGSEIGLIEKVLGKGGGALAGRHHLRIHLHPLTEESSVEFLRKGFLEAGKKVPSYELWDAVDKLGTLIGWLNYYGYLRLTQSHSEALNQVIDNGKIIVKTELDNFLENRRNKKLYISILSLLSEGEKSWAEMHQRLNITKSRLSEALERLVEYGFVVKETKYRLADKMLKYIF